MYEKCLSCPRLGVSCGGPRLPSMPADDLLEWCRQRKAQLGLSNAALAEKAGLPKGTVDRLFAWSHADFRYETIRIIVKALIGWETGYGNFPDSRHEDVGLQEKVSLMEEHQHENLDTIHFLRRQITTRQRTIWVLSALLGIAILVIITALVTDLMNNNVGFLWLR